MLENLLRISVIISSIVGLVHGCSPECWIMGKYYVACWNRLSLAATLVFHSWIAPPPEFHWVTLTFPSNIFPPLSPCTTCNPETNESAIWEYWAVVKIVSLSLVLSVCHAVLRSSHVSLPSICVFTPSGADIYSCIRYIFICIFLILAYISGNVNYFNTFYHERSRKACPRDWRMTLII